MALCRDRRVVDRGACRRHRCLYPFLLLPPSLSPPLPPLLAWRSGFSLSINKGERRRRRSILINDRKPDDRKGRHETDRLHDLPTYRDTAAISRFSIYFTVPLLAVNSYRDMNGETRLRHLVRTRAWPQTCYENTDKVPTPSMTVQRITRVITHTHLEGGW